MRIQSDRKPNAPTDLQVVVKEAIAHQLQKNKQDAKVFETHLGTKIDTTV
jgi:hypothetical protein